MAKIEVRTPRWWRVVEIVSGILVIILAGVLIGDSQLVTSTVALILGVSLLVVGLSRIGVGVFARLLPSWYRALNAGGESWPLYWLSKSSWTFRQQRTRSSSS